MAIYANPGYERNDVTVYRLKGKNQKMKKPEIRPSHVALLVPSVQKTADFLKPHGFEIGQAENWEGEGTKEIYIEQTQANSLLLMEPAKPGAYERAMKKRGPGLHHLAIDVLNLNEFITSITHSGWLIHPVSIRTMKDSQTAYLAKPGFPALIEVQERNELKTAELFVTRIELSLGEAQRHLVAAIGLEEIVHPTQDRPNISLGIHQMLSLIHI